MPADNSIAGPGPENAASGKVPEIAGFKGSLRKKSVLSTLLPVLARFVLGGAFLYMGMHKVLAPSEFLSLVRQYNLTNNYYALNVIAAALPWFEVFCGLLLVLGIGVRGTALVVLGMLLPFSIVVLRRALAMAATQGLSFCAVKFDCGCGGGEIVICDKLIENGAYILVALWLVLGPPQRLSVRYSLVRPKGT